MAYLSVSIKKAEFTVERYSRKRNLFTREPEFLMRELKSGLARARFERFACLLCLTLINALTRI